MNPMHLHLKRRKGEEGERRRRTGMCEGREDGEGKRLRLRNSRTRTS